MIKRKPFSKEQLVELLQPFTSYMTPEQTDSLPDVCTISEYGRDTYIYKQGDVADTMFCLLQGAAIIYMGDDGLQPKIMAILKKGDFFGYEASFLSQNHLSSCIAKQGAVVCSIPLRLLTPILYSNPDIMQYMLKRMADALLMSRLRYVRQTQKHVRGRLADALLQLVDRFGFETDGATIDVCLSREELASMANMTPANAIRTLSAFAAENVIEINRRNIKILKIETLRNISRHD